MPPLKPKKMWEKSRKLRVIKPSKYELSMNARSYWSNIIGCIEEEVRSDKLTDTNIRKFKEILPTSTFRKIQKVLQFNLPVEDQIDSFISEESGSVIPSEEFYKLAGDSPPITIFKRRRVSSLMSGAMQMVSGSQFSPSIETLLSEAVREEEAYEENESVQKSDVLSKSTPITIPRHANQDTPCSTKESLKNKNTYNNRSGKENNLYNPHHELLHTNKSESDMISWDSKYKPKKLTVSASDAFSRKAELVTKQIAIGFIDYFNSLDSDEYTSQINKPEDIEILFQVWFDELVSRGLTVDPLILPCVLQQVADASGNPEASCPNMTRRQVNFDIKAETTPKHVVCFNTALPQKMKHVPPDNNTKALWETLVIPEDLETMSYIWEDIQHLSTTKSFYHWLLRHPTKPIPACMKTYFMKTKRRSTFVVPSDLIIRESSEEIEENLTLPFSSINIKMKEVLSSMALS